MTATQLFGSFDVQYLRVLLVMLALLAVVSWEDAASDQHSRMHPDADDGGAACSMHIDYGHYR